MRKVMKGRMLLSDVVLTDLVKEDVISKEEAKMLKDFKITEEGKPRVKVSGRGRSAKLKKIKFVPLDIARKVKVKRPSSGKFRLLEPTDLSVPTINTGVKVPQIKISSTSSPKFKVKFNL